MINHTSYSVLQEVLINLKLLVVSLTSSLLWETERILPGGIVNCNPGKVHPS